MSVLHADESLLADVCRLPTAPFAESAVLAYVDTFAATTGLTCRADEYGNRLIELGPYDPKTDPRCPRLVFVAHVDHPGFIAGLPSGRDPRQPDAAFFGGVDADYLPGCGVRFFDVDREVRGTVLPDVRLNDRGRPTGATVRLEEPVPPGSAGMFDLPSGDVCDVEGRRRWVGRCCDDLAGVAAALAMLRRLAGDPRDVPAVCPVAVLLTRAEEEGFIGTLAAIRDASDRPGTSLLRQCDRVVSIETSAAQPAAPLGGGVTVRVGDATSVFSSRLTYFLNEQAKTLATQDAATGEHPRGFRFTRALMPGGTCEATPFDLAGFEAAAVCVPLANYHNMNRPTRRIDSEQIDLGDWRCLVRLLERAARRTRDIERCMDPLRRRLEERLARHVGRLGRSSVVRETPASGPAVHAGS